MRSFFAGIRTLVLPFGAGPGTPRGVIGPDVPAALTAAYAAKSLTVTWAIIFESGTIGRYQYIAQVVNAVGYSRIGLGGVDAGVVSEIVSLGYISGISGLFFGDVDNIGGAVLPQIGMTTAGTSDIKWDSATLERGVASFVDAAADTAAIGAEAVTLTLPAMTFRQGRAYRVVWAGRLNSSAAQVISARIRKTNLAGTVLMVGQYQRLAAEQTSEHYEGFIGRANGAGDLTGVTLVQTLAATAGTVTGRGAADTVRWFGVWDCGDVDDYPNAVLIT